MQRCTQVSYPCHSEALAEESIELSFVYEILHCVQNDNGGSVLYDDNGRV